MSLLQMKYSKIFTGKEYLCYRVETLFDFPVLISRLFEKIVQHCRTYSDLIPLSFVLGFYVSLVVKRWWEIFQCM